MADFALWAAACEQELWPPGTFSHAYKANRQAAMEDLSDADPVGLGIRSLTVERAWWARTASDPLRAVAHFANENNRAGWPKTPDALAGRLRRAQTFLRMLGIEICFSREGRAGTRTISITSGPRAKPTASAPSAPSALLATRGRC